MNTNDLGRIIDMNNEVYVLGVLATDRDEYPNIVIRQAAVAQMKNSDSVVFFVQAISDEPKYARDELNRELDQELRNLYIGIDVHHNSMAEYPFYPGVHEIPYNYNSIDDKEDIILNELRGRLLIFKINIQKNNSDGTIYKNILLQSVLDIDDDGSWYKTIPEVQGNIDTFESKLIEGRSIYLKGYPHDMDVPEGIICEDYIYVDFDEDNFERVEATDDAWRFVGDINQIRKLPFDISDEDYDTNVIAQLENIVFIKENYFYDELCSEDKKSVLGYLEVVDNTREIEFLREIKNYTMKKSLYYDMKDIINLHISIKTNYMTIVAGMSGTGKTQISLAYAQALGLSEEEGTLLFLPITPSYTEPEDILGYLNTTTGVYISSETGLVDFLIHAQANPDKLHFVVFDEMNLSQVEHWFAPFISLLELDQKDRNLRLYSKNAVCNNNSKYKPILNIGDNVRFIGTVNLDETTKDFSDRLLDRANLVTLKKGTFKDFKDEKIEFLKDSQDEKLEDNDLDKDMSFTFEEFQSWIKKDVTIDRLSDDEIDLLDEIHRLISINDSQKGISFRIANKIASYLQNIPIDEGGRDALNRGTALDLQIKQRVLTKIKGTERQLGNLIGTIDLASGNVENSALYDILDGEVAKKIGDFEFTKNEIRRKARELTVYGYAN